MNLSAGGPPLLIISESDDLSTLEVQRWLNSYGIDWVRINASTELILYELDLESRIFTIGVSGRVVDLFQVRNCWYRRGFFKFYGQPDNPNLLQFERNENRYLNYYIFKSFLESGGQGFLGNYLLTDVNKLLVLELAAAIGLRTPHTYLSGRKVNIEKHLKEQGQMITKTIGTQLYFEENGDYFMGYTEDVLPSDPGNLDDQFFPSLLQQKIPKKYEIRTFFLDDHFYSMAIFSQRNPQTATDFRKYDDVLPNRLAPFKLPEEIEGRLKLLLASLKLNTASLDLLVDQTGEYIFLEVNPVGQFGMVSQPCNYYLEKELAARWSNKSKSLSITYT